MTAACHTKSKRYPYKLHNRFLLLILPCDDLFLRSKATQNPTYSVQKNERLHDVIEREVVELFEREIKYQ